MRMTQLHWWADGTPGSFCGVSIGAGSAHVAELVRVLQASGVERIEIRKDEDDWIKLTPDVRDALLRREP